MAMHTTEVTTRLSDAELSAVCDVTQKSNPQKAVAHLVKQAVEMAALRVQYPRPHKPNAATVRALRAKPSKQDKTFDNAKDAVAFLRKRYG